jgi:Zn finger protein HypA/HybF involved in hydrogenase expression
MKKRTSPIWSIPPEKFQQLLNTSNSFVDILIKIGLDPYNGNHKTLNHRIKEEGFDISILEENRRKSRERHMKSLLEKKTYKLKDILVENSKYGSHHLKNKLILQNILKNECSICKNNGEWFGKKLSLQLDHINGINNDNRLENLRLLCPNCHSQTETFSGKRHKKYNFCKDCGEKVQKQSTRCFKCSSKNNGVNQRKFEVSREELKNLIASYPMTKVGKILGVSDNAVRKRCKLFGLL